MVKIKENKTKETQTETGKIQTPIRYPGSKFRASKYILPFIEKINYDEYREPFLGSGAIFFNTFLVKYSWINDIDKDLIITFKVMSKEKDRDWLEKKVRNIKPTKEYFNKLRDKKYTDNRNIAFRYFVLNRTAYSGIMNKPNWGFHPYKSVQPSKWPILINKAGKKLKKVWKITSIDYEKIITSPKKGNNVLMFIDPPYFNADQKRAYKYSFTREDHLKLMNLLKSTKFNFCLTYDNCPEIKQIYSWAKIHEVEWMYHTANSNETTRKKGRELIITNY